MAVSDYDSVSDLRAATPPAGAASAVTRGYYAPGDGGGAMFAWSAASTAADDGGSVLQPTGTTGAGRWLFVGDEITLRQFGARGDAATDDEPVLVRVNGSAVGSVTVTPGIYRVDSSITITKPLRFQPGGILRPFTGVVVTIAAPFEAPLSQVFDPITHTTVPYNSTVETSKAYVQFGRGVAPEFRFEWWGARADDSQDGSLTSTDSTLPINFAIQAVRFSLAKLAGGTFRLPTVGFFRITDEIELPRQQVVNIVGEGEWGGFVFFGSAPGNVEHYENPARFALRYQESQTSVSRQVLDNFRISCPSGASGLFLNNTYDEGEQTLEGNGFRWMNLSRLWIEGSGGATLATQPKAGSYGIRLAMLTNSVLSDLLIQEFDINVSSYLAGNPCGGNTVIQCTAANGVTANWELTSWLSTTFIRLRSESLDYFDPIEHPDKRRPVQVGYDIEDSYGNNFIQCSGEDSYEVAGWLLTRCFRIVWHACALGSNTAPAGVGVRLVNVDMSQWRSGHVSGQGSGVSFELDTGCNGNTFEDVGLLNGFASFVDNGVRTRKRLIDMSNTFGTHTVWPQLNLVAGMPIKKVSVSGQGVVPSDLGLVLVDTSSGPITFTLNTPAAGTAAGVPLEIVNTGTNTLTVQTQGGVHTFQMPGVIGATSFTLTGQNHRAVLRHDGGTVWYGNRITT